MNQISKVVGFTTITVQGQDIPVKFGMQAFSDFIEHYGIELADIVDKVFKWVEREEKDENGDTNKYQALVPKKPFEVAPVMLWAGANWVNKFDGGKGFRIIDASNWIDELGGINSEKLAPVWAAFWDAYKNGGTPPVVPAFETEEQKKSEPVSQS